jgi:hypothetical protein
VCSCGHRTQEQKKLPRVSFFFYHAFIFPLARIILVRQFNAECRDRNYRVGRICFCTNFFFNT